MFNLNELETNGSQTIDSPPPKNSTFMNSLKGSSTTVHTTAASNLSKIVIKPSSIKFV